MPFEGHASLKKKKQNKKKKTTLITQVKCIWLIITHGFKNASFIFATPDYKCNCLRETQVRG